ncbi:BON domain-containing protein [Gilvimarinus sp. SDUM040013]|uniref:BON domain-containing protein n=1 Tax=Gilvimarinus gilvus TaxID=3058038 RepID=A0ABU4RY88_9GAMM|nr:BON domain-containing protein [Gilvimarinus sp. SDUM040013]MDO3388515.1 BON domain-containing protein [Gilvimarinus sp. SDUM040013]MDX6848613.1 BON domain-containing protein [Gilvimarinus sp. SDUM040013]
MKLPTKKTLLATTSAAFVTASMAAPSVLAEEQQYEKKRTAEQYWSEFKQDAEQNWDTTKVAFRDGWVEGKLETAIVMNEHLNPFQIDLKVDGNVATLSGDVSSAIERELASNIALGIEGIDEVNNKLKVVDDIKPEAKEEGRDFAQYVEDLSTTAAIKTELVSSSNISGLDINVDTFRDEVTLEGTVDSEAEKELVEAIVKKREGVASVDNQLQVQS